MISFFIEDVRKLGLVRRVSITLRGVPPVPSKKRRGGVPPTVVEQKPLIELLMDDYTL